MDLMLDKSGVLSQDVPLGSSICSSLKKAEKHLTSCSSGFAKVLQVLALEVPLPSSVSRVRAGLPLQLQLLFTMNSVCTLELKAENVCLLYSQCSCSMRSKLPGSNAGKGTTINKDLNGLSSIGGWLVVEDKKPGKGEKCKTDWNWKEKLIC